MKPEARLRVRCAMFLNSHLSAPCWFSALEHGRRHHGTAEQRAREWQALARQGLKTGIGDMLILAPGYALMVELKTATGRLSDAQIAMQNAMSYVGHGYVIARSVEALGEALERHGIPLAAGWRVAAMRHDAALDGDAPKRTRATKPRAARPKASALAKLRGAGVLV